MPRPDGPTLEERFRGNVRVRAPLHPLERVVLALTCLHLGFLPWALGTMHAWSQVTSLCLAGVTFLVALLPRTYSGELARGLAPAEAPRAKGQEARAPISGSSPFPLTPLPAAPLAGVVHYAPWRRLVRFPLFWLGAALLAYIAIQGANPSWVWQRNATHWWLERVNDIPWLPTSVDTPWERFNLWRQFVIYASAWLTVCALWIGLTRRRSIEMLLMFLILNGVLLGAAGLYLRATATADTVFWINARVPYASAFASFIYRNHAGAYVALLAMSALALALSHHERGQKKLLKSTPAALLALCFVYFVVCELFTYSRGATLILAFVFTTSVVYLLGRILVTKSARQGVSVATVALAILVAGVVGVVAWKVDFGTMNRRLHSLVSNYDQEYSVRGRLAATDAGIDMLEQYWTKGVGAGGFRFLFPGFIQRHPEFYRNGRVFWEHAHNDWLQVPIELGAVGVSFLVLGAAWLARSFANLKIWRSAVGVILALGALQTLVHAWFDFPFQNPAVLVTWSILVLGTLRLAESGADSTA